MSSRGPIILSRRAVDDKCCLECNSVLLWATSWRQPEDARYVEYEPVGWPVLSNFRISAGEGCAFCGFILDMLLSERVASIVRAAIDAAKDHNNPQLIVSVGQCLMDGEFSGAKYDPALYLSLKFSCLDAPVYFMIVAHSVRTSQHLVSAMGLLPPFSQSYPSKAHVDWMRGQIESCLDHRHELQEDGFVPERLIDVSGTTLRLVLRSEIAREAEGHQITVPHYAALRYCWGSAMDAAHQLTTTSSTLSQRRRDIPLNELPQSLQDAVAVARALFIPYLWTDALCILQDDDVDWNHQCIDMCKIYGNSYVTLCASSSISCRDSFLQQRGILCRIPVLYAEGNRWQPGLPSSYDLRAFFCGDEFPVSPVFWDMLHSRWARRGWVIQERISATRKLVFGDANLHFICNSHFGSFNSQETQTWPLITQSSLHRLIDASDLPTALHSWSRAADSVARPGSLTKAGDVLPALSSLAARCSRELSSDYAAGHWVRYMHLDLMWFAWVPRSGGLHNHIHLSSHQNMGPDYIAPTWSVVSPGTYPKGMIFDGIETFNNHLSEACFVPRMQLAGDNTFGAIRHGMLEVRGRVLDLSHPALSKLYTQLPDNDSDEANPGPILRLGVEDICKINLDFMYASGLWFQDATYKSQWVAGLGEDLPMMKLLLLGSCREWRASSAWIKRWMKPRGAYGLILYPEPNSMRFQRVGIFYPTTSMTSTGGFYLFKRLGEIKTVVVE